MSKINEVHAILKKAGVRTYVDDRDNYTPGWKFSNWELKGVPIRIEIGKNEVSKEEVSAVLRHNGERQTISWANLAT
jgi:prolyl-tRNA synthetase